MPTIPRQGPHFSFSWGPGTGRYTQELIIEGRTASDCTEEALFLFVDHMIHSTAVELGQQLGARTRILSRHLVRGPVTRRHARFTFIIRYGLPGHPAIPYSDSDDEPLNYHSSSD